MQAQMKYSDTHGGIEKIKRYGWTMKNQPGVMQVIAKSNLNIDPEYQRVPIKAKVLAIAADFSWIGFGVLIVAKRKGKYWIIDGQHRYLAALSRSDIHVLPCIVFTTEDSSQEAMGFVESNTLRKPITASARHRASVIAKDPLAVKIQGVFDELELEPTDGGHSRNRVNCVSTCYAIAKKDFDAFTKIIAVATEACIQDNIQLHDRLLQGLFYIHRNYDGGITEPKIRSRIVYVGASNLIAAANRAAVAFTTGGEKQWAFGMFQAINKNLKNKFVVKGFESL